MKTLNKITTIVTLIAGILGIIWYTYNFNDRAKAALETKNNAQNKA